MVQIIWIKNYHYTSCNCLQMIVVLGKKCRLGKQMIVVWWEKKKED